MLLNSGSLHWDLSEQCCSCAFAWPCVLLHLGLLAGLRLASSPWASLEITGLQQNFVTILRLTQFSFCGYRESVPMPVRVLPFQACCHTQVSGHLPLLSNSLLLLPADSCQYFFSIKIPSLWSCWGDLQNKGFFYSIAFLQFHDGIFMIK